MLPVSLDCLFLIASSVFSNVYLRFEKKTDIDFSAMNDKKNLMMYKQIQQQYSEIKVVGLGYGR